MGAHNDTANDYQLFNTGTQTIADPGSGETFDLRGIDRGVATIASGTRVLPDNIPLGVSLTVYATGSVTITTVAAVTMASLTSGQIATFTARTATTWNVVIHSTTSATSLNAINTSLTTQYGFIHIPLTSWREVVSNDIAALATAGTTGSGGVLATDTTPTLEYVNGDTDSTLRMLWAAANVDPIATQIMLPSDCDITAGLSFKACGLMSGAIDTPLLSLDTYFVTGAGSVTSKIEDDTSAFSSSRSTVTASIATGDIPSTAIGVPVFATIEVTPGSHGTDTLRVDGTWIQYTKKLLTA
jgi:hypothetical protein